MPNKICVYIHIIFSKLTDARAPVVIHVGPPLVQTPINSYCSSTEIRNMQLQGKMKSYITFLLLQEVKVIHWLNCMKLTIIGLYQCDEGKERQLLTRSIAWSREKVDICWSITFFTGWAAASPARAASSRYTTACILSPSCSRWSRVVMKSTSSLTTELWRWNEWDIKK